MSYTNAKIIWEKCNTVSTPIEKDVLLIDANNNALLDIEYKLLTVEEETYYNEYGDSIMDEYNDISRTDAIVIRARKQPHEEILKTSDGKEILTKSYFYVDPRVEPNALSIEKMDKLDGEIVMQKYIMCGLRNKPIMVRYITI